MSREIKFRAWDEKNNRYHMNGLVVDLNYSMRCNEIMFDNDNSPDLRAHKLLLEQFTGLKDKNGVEIYEGDTVEGFFDIDDIPDETYLGLPKEVLSKGSITKEVIIPDIYRESFPDDIEIIGNIHEDPELLK